MVPEDGKNLNRCFPGDPAGPLADRLAYDITELILGSDAYIDAHCGDLVEALRAVHSVRGRAGRGPGPRPGLAYGLEYVIRQVKGPDRAVAGTTSGAAAEAGIPAITAEAGGCGLVEGTRSACTSRAWTECCDARHGRRSAAGRDPGRRRT